MGLNIVKITLGILFLIFLSCSDNKKTKREFENFLFGEWKGGGEHIYFSQNYVKYDMYKKNLWAISKWRIVKIDKKRSLIYINFYDIKLTEDAINLNKKYGLPVENILKPVNMIYIFDEKKQKIKVYKGGNTPENVLKKISEKQKP